MHLSCGCLWSLHIVACPLGCHAGRQDFTQVHDIWICCVSNMLVIWCCIWVIICFYYNDELEILPIDSILFPVHRVNVNAAHYSRTMVSYRHHLTGIPMRCCSLQCYIAQWYLYRLWKTVSVIANCRHISWFIAWNNTLVDLVNVNKSNYCSILSFCFLYITYKVVVYHEPFLPHFLHC